MPSNKNHLENFTYSCIVYSLIKMALLTEERLKGMQQGLNYEKSERDSTIAAPRDEAARAMGDTK